MLIVMDKDATPAQIEAVVAKIQGLGYVAQPIPGGERVAIGILRNPGPVDPALFLDMPGVIQAIPVSKPYKLVSREMKRADTLITFPNGLTIGRGHFVLIAGPCAVESETQALTIAHAVKAAGAQIFRGGAHKHRTSPYCYQGPGEPGLTMLLPLVVIDVHDKVALNPDYCVTLADIRAWEAKYGEVPEGAFVALRTDWSKRWPDAARMQNKDDNGVAHYPGWSMEVLKYLYEVRKITASGHETTDTDPGIATSKGDYSLEAYILNQDHYQVELLANLDKVPEYGALVVVVFPKPRYGSGFPARVFAILP